MKDFIVSLVFLFLSVFTLIASEAFNRKGKNAFSLANNPAVYPRLLAAILFVLSCVLLFQSIRKGALKNIKIKIAREKLLKVVKLFFTVIVYVCGIYFAGYVISSAVCIFFFILLYGGKVRSAIIYSVAATIVLYLVFQVGFKVRLPVGYFFV